MERSLLSFLKAIGEDQFLRKMYRADPIRALTNYGITEMSPAEWASLETRQALADLPNRTAEDVDAFKKIMMQSVLFPNGWV